MAARLVRRCCWRHFSAFVSPPSAVPASLLVPAGKVAVARAQPQAPFASFHTSSPSSWADGFSVKEQVEDTTRNPEHRVIVELIETATSPQDLLQLSELHVLNSNQSSLVITQLSRLAAEKNLETKSILQDERFQQLIGIMDSQVSSLLAAEAFWGKNTMWKAESAPGIEQCGQLEPAAHLGFVLLPFQVKNEVEGTRR